MIFIVLILAAATGAVLLDDVRLVLGVEAALLVVAALALRHFPRVGRSGLAERGVRDVPVLDVQPAGRKLRVDFNAALAGEPPCPRRTILDVPPQCAPLVKSGVTLPVQVSPHSGRGQVQWTRFLLGAACPERASPGGAAAAWGQPFSMRGMVGVLTLLGGCAGWAFSRFQGSEDLRLMSEGLQGILMLPGTSAVGLVLVWLGPSRAESALPPAALRALGIPAVATVRSFAPGNRSSDLGHSVELVVSVAADGCEPYAIQVELWWPNDLSSRLDGGVELPVWIDPQNPNRFLMDWDHFAPDQGSKAVSREFGESMLVTFRGAPASLALPG